MAAVDETPSSAGSGGKQVRLLRIVAVVVYLIDLASKAAVVAELEGRPAVPVFGTWMQLRVQRNPGAAFGIGSAATIVFSVLAVVVAVVVVRLSRRLTSRSWALALGLLLGGALGNLTDRVFRSPGDLSGAVVDFIAVRGFSVMNLADWAISCGAVLAIWASTQARRPVGKRDHLEQSA
ncbi:signal peptidase II [Nocardia sp. NPDC088792]|uniref:signal peptidase II n=1 Tax=Nocardia sp. NPDC088792 TaxID=3364332 RepID=UPI00381FDE6D